MKSEEFAAAVWASTWETVEDSPDACEQGAVSFDAERGISLDIPFGEILKDPTILVLPRDSAFPESLDWLYGFSQDGYWLAIKDVTWNGSGRSIPGGAHQHLAGRQLLRSRGRFNPTEPVIKANLKLVGLREWFGRVAMKTTQSTEPARTLTVSAGLRDKNYNEVLLDNADYRIELFHRFHVAGPSVAGVNISHDCSLAIDFKKPRELDEAEEVLVHIADFFSFCCGFFAEIESVRVKFSGSEEWVSCYFPAVKGASPKKTQFDQIPLGYSVLEKSIAHFLESWVYADDELRPCITLLCSLMFRSWKLPLDLRFIAVSQLLEALSKYHADRDSIPLEDYKARIDTLKVAVQAIEDESVRQWAMERLPGNAKGQKRLLEELVERHPVAADWLFPNGAKLVKRQVALRNRFTHRDSQNQGIGAEAVEVLYWHTEAVLLFCYLVVADIVGLDSRVVIKALEKSRFKYRVRQKSVELFASDKDEAKSQEGAQV